MCPQVPLLPREEGTVCTRGLIIFLWLSRKPSQLPVSNVSPWDAFTIPIAKGPLSVKHCDNRLVPGRRTCRHIHRWIYRQWVPLREVFWSPQSLTLGVLSRQTCTHPRHLSRQPPSKSTEQKHPLLASFESLAYRVGRNVFHWIIITLFWDVSRPPCVQSEPNKIYLRWCILLNRNRARVITHLSISPNWFLGGGPSLLAGEVFIPP